MIANEKELYEIIENKTIDEVKEVFKENSINSKQFNHFKEILKNLILSKKSFEVINFIIEQQSQDEKKCNRELFFYSVESKRFDIAQLFLNYGTQITVTSDANIDNYKKLNIIEYLCEKKKLDSENLLFILKTKDGKSFVNTNTLYQIIKSKNEELINIIFKHNYPEIEIILKLIFASKNKIALSNNFFLNFKILNIIEKNFPEDDYLPVKVIKENNTESIQLLLEYLYKKNIPVYLEDEDFDNNKYPLLYAAENNNTEIVQWLLKYARKFNIKLNLNQREKDDYYYGYGYYPLKYAVENDNIEMVKLLIEYANENNIIIEKVIDDIDREYSDAYNQGFFFYDDYLESAIEYNNIEMVKLLLQYAKDNNIILEVSKSNIMDIIKRINNQKMNDVLLSYKDNIVLITEYYRCHIIEEEFTI